MANYTQVTFGSGKLFLKQGSNAYQVGLLEDVTVNFEGSTKSKSGGYQYPIISVMTNKKVTGKASFAQIDGRTISSLLSGTATVGRVVVGEFVTTAATSTVAPTGTAFIADLGVTTPNYGALKLTASAGDVNPVTYYQSNGIYNVYSTNATGSVISYSYQLATGQTLEGKNQLQGTQTSYSIFLQEKDADGDIIGFELPQVIIPNLNFSFKAEDFGVNDISFEAMADSGGTVYKIYTP